MLSRKQKMGTASTDNWLSRLRGGDRAVTERQVETKEECFHVLVCVYMILYVVFYLMGKIVSHYSQFPRRRGAATMPKCNLCPGQRASK